MDKKTARTVASNALMCAVVCISIIFGLSLRGTFAWFYGGEESIYGSFSTAKVQLAKKSENVLVYGTNEGQSLFDGINNHSNIYDWWDAVKNDFDQVSNVTVGCVVVGTYEFENVSNIPVYLRISKPELSSVAGVSFYMTINPSDPNPSLLADGIGYWYYLKPLAPPPDYSSSGDFVTVEFFACIPQSITWSDALLDWHAESIQSTNNAVYLAEGWKSASGWLPAP